MNKSTCNICGKSYRMGYTGTVDGCDKCLGNVRDKDGYVYGPNEKFITLENITTKRQTRRKRPAQRRGLLSRLLGGK